MRVGLITGLVTILLLCASCGSSACEAPRGYANRTYGCNGSPPGPGEANQPGGTCGGSSSGNPSGSCVDPNTMCVKIGDRPGEPVCMYRCEPTSYVSAGGCPAGWRCFDVSGGICFPDCRRGADCATGVCDSEGSCVW